MVPPAVENAGSASNNVTKGKNNVNTTKPASGCSPTVPNTEIHDLSLVRTAIIDHGTSQESCELIMSSWKTGTKRQYGPYIRNWERFCYQRGIDPISPSIADGLQFLTNLFHNGLGYSAINTARSALSTVISLSGGITFGSHPLVCRLLKGVYTERPALPRYNVTWDVNIVLKYLSDIPLQDINLKSCSHKVVMLLALLTGQRCQTLHAITLNEMTLSASKCVIAVKSLLKTSRPNHRLSPIELRAYSENANICVVSYLKSYLKLTHSVRGECQKLFISYVKPHRAVSKDTISRWIKDVLQKSGVDTSVFTAHSTRSASTSAAKVSQVPMEQILNAADGRMLRHSGNIMTKLLLIVIIMVTCC